MSRRPAAVIDTNVVVAGLLTKVDTSPVAHILNGMLAGALSFALSETLLAEYRKVLLRHRVREGHGLSVSQIDALLTDIAQHAIVLAPASGPPAPDPGDQMLWDLLAAHPELVLVTGDKPLLGSAPMRGRVISPMAFLSGQGT